MDGCKGGWLVATAQEVGSERRIDCRVCVSFGAVLRQSSRWGAVAVDIPIGLTDGPPRECDTEARKVLRPPRASSVFPAPIRQVLNVGTYEVACEEMRRQTGKALSKQSFAILRKVAEVDGVMNPKLQKRIVEIHPEVCFWAMNGYRAMRQNKRVPEGIRERRRLLRRVLPELDGFLEKGVPPGAGVDDFHDALAALWTAMSYTRDHFGRLPPEPAKDSRGLRMEMVYPLPSGMGTG